MRIPLSLTLIAILPALAQAGCYKGEGACAGSSPSASSSSSASPSAVSNTETVIGALGAAAAAFDASRTRTPSDSDEEATAREARLQHHQAVTAAKTAEHNANVKAVQDTINSAKNNLDASTSSAQDVQLDKCIRKSYSKGIDGKFSLENTCTHMLNIKYTFSKSKPLSGTYSTLRPGQVTLEAAATEETFKYVACDFPTVPQDMNGGCI